MLVRHVPCQADPALASAKQRAWIYRTEVENDQDRPIRVIWFEFYFQDTHHDGGDWFGVNVRNRPLRTPDFLEWYGDGLTDDSGWIQPGEVAVCDPNYHFAFGEELSPVKWSYLAVDEAGKDQLVEAEVKEEAVQLFDPDS